MKKLFRSLVDQLHTNSRRHRNHMNEATKLIEAGYRVRDHMPFDGWMKVQEGIEHVVKCGCRRELWPAYLQAKIEGQV